MTFLKKNEKQENNLRDLGFAYGLAFVFYELVALLGGLAITNKSCTNTMINCYLTDWTVLIVEVSYLYGLICVFPCNFSVCRTRLLELFFGKVTPRQFRFFSIGFMVVASFFSIISPFLSLSLVMGFSGSLVCFLFIYLVPTKMHYGCLYEVRKVAHKNIEDEISDPASTTETNQSLLE
jgi:hypothetical protein